MCGLVINESLVECLEGDGGLRVKGRGNRMLFVIMKEGKMVS